jgi:RNA-binding protein Nova
LVKNPFAGCLIGSNGNAIKELMEITHAKVQVSGPSEFYPGTFDRVLMVSGTCDEINNAVSVIVELMVDFSANSRGTKDWSPSELLNRTRSDGINSVEDGVKLTIPAAAGGLIIGNQGSTLKSLMDSSQAKAVMTSREDAVFTNERVITINGVSGEVKQFIELLLMKLLERPDLCVYLNKGTRYYANNSSLISPSSRSSSGRSPGSRDNSGGGGRRDSAPSSRSRSGERRDAGSRPSDADSGAIDSEETTITMRVAEGYIGFILGKRGATLKEMMDLSKATIKVSPKEQMESDKTRIVTITGSPQNASTAHRFCTERIKQGQKSHSDDA